jgi:hypothetical protein
MRRLRKTALLSHLYIKMIILPRQARGKHRENSKKDAVFRTAAVGIRNLCIFEPFIYKNEHFTKTGSGQT